MQNQNDCFNEVWCHRICLNYYYLKTKVIISGKTTGTKTRSITITFRKPMISGASTICRSRQHHAARGCIELYLMEYYRIDKIFLICSCIVSIFYIWPIWNWKPGYFQNKKPLNINYLAVFITDCQCFSDSSGARTSFINSWLSNCCRGG